MEVTIFPEPSGNIRGFAIEMMELQKGKKTVEKRILHANIYQNDPLDYISVELPTRMSPDEVREAAAKMIAFANEVERQYDHHQTEMKAPITFRRIQEAYISLLTANPGKALRIDDSSDNTVVFMHNGNLVSGYMNASGNLYNNECYEFDRNAWNSEAGCWDCDSTHEVTIKFVNEPRFVDYTLIED